MLKQFVFVILGLLIFSPVSDSGIIHELDKKNFVDHPAPCGETFCIHINHLKIKQRIFEYPEIKTEKFFDNRMRYFNGSVLVAKKGEILFTKNFGKSAIRSGEPISEKSSFQLASLSKQFTAAAILLLHQKTLLNIDSAVVNYIPEFPYSEITIRQLLNHTSGLPNYMWLLENKWNRKEIPDNKETMKMFCNADLPLYFKPGSRFDYSNTGYFVLATIVEEVTKTSFQAFMQKNFFLPIGMSNTGFYDSDNANQLSGYRKGRRRNYIIPQTVNDGVLGDKGLYSNAVDMFKWHQSIINYTLLNKEMVDLAFQNGKTNSERKVPYGFGYRLKNSKSDSKIYHHGVWNGFTNAYEYTPEDSLLVIVLSNNSYQYISYIVHKMREIAVEYNEFLELALAIQKEGICFKVEDKNELFENYSVFSKDRHLYNDIDSIMRRTSRSNYMYLPIK